MSISKFTELSLDATSSETVISLDEPPPLYDAAFFPGSEIIVPPQANIDYLAYRIPGSTLSDDRTIRYVNITESGDARNLQSLIETQLSLPPRPLIRIRGTHVDRLYSWGTTKVDFDLILDLTPYLASHYHDLQVCGYANGSDNSKGDNLRQCSDHLHAGKDASLILERKVAGWDPPSLHDSIRELVRSTRYQGDLSITFPIQHAQVIFSRDNQTSQAPTQSWFSRMRASSSTTLSSSSMPTETRLSVIWPFPPALTAAGSASAPSTSSSFPAHSHPPCSSSPSPSNITTTHISTPTQPDPIFINTWRAPMLNAVLSRRTGYITLADWQDIFINDVPFPNSLPLSLPRLLPLANKDWGTTGEDWAMLIRGLREGGRKRSAGGRGPECRGRGV